MVSLWRFRASDEKGGSSRISWIAFGADFLLILRMVGEQVTSDGRKSTDLASIGEVQGLIDSVHLACAQAQSVSGATFSQEVL
jgi:hypothetical protein